jgi:hypothetical protein
MKKICAYLLCIMSSSVYAMDQNWLVKINGVETTVNIGANEDGSRLSDEMAIQIALMLVFMHRNNVALSTQRSYTELQKEKQHRNASNICYPESKPSAYKKSRL